MKRSLLFALIIAGAVAAVASISHATGWFAGLELPLKNWMVKLNGPARDLSNIWQYSLTPLLGFATAWITITSARRHRIAVLVLAAILELVTLAWVLSLYHISFTPLPCILAVVLSYSGGVGYSSISGAQPGGTPPLTFHVEISTAPSF